VRTPLSTVDLWNRKTRSCESAELFGAIEESNLADVEQRWLPQIAERRKSISSPADLALANLQDAHWDWRKKVQERRAYLAYESFALECASVTQGLMLVETTHFGRLAAHKGLELVYIEYLATAPWNRHGFTSEPLYKGVGQILLAVAVSLSVDLGFRGRIGLHSLPQSEEWYRTICRMTDLGIDKDYPPGILHYFEFTEAQASSFIS
jgi:hypothetical protein